MNLCKSFLLVLGVFTPISWELSLEEFLTLSHSEKLKLDEFKERVVPRLPQEYMKQDAYLIRFLRENDFDMEASERMLINMLNWRKEKEIDTILNEDFSEFEEEYTAYIEGCDFEGRPVISLIIGGWDIRKEVIAGRGDKMLRYTDKVYEESVQTVLKMQAEGQNVTQVTLIADMSGFNVLTHACPRCIPIYINILISLQTHYPGYVHRVVAVNSPSFAIPLWENLKYVMSPKLREVLRIFGTNKRVWQKYLFQEMDKSQLSKKFGGTRKESLDLQELRKSGLVFRCSRNFWEYSLK